ncbi:glycosyltransferase family 2 protein [Spirosoma aerophilum]
MPINLPPELSIILVSYNSLTDLQRCLPTIYSQSAVLSFDVIIVDNHGKDGVAEWLAQAHPSILFIKNPANSGYAGGNNLGLTQAKGQWVLFLNPDTKLAPDFLARLMTTARQHPQALITPKLLNPDGTINACGNEMHYTGLTTCRGLNQPSSAFTQLQSVPLLSGAALLAPRAVLQTIGSFDETYFMYFEDTQLSMRAKLAGFELLCEPAAVLTHYYKLGMSPTKFYYLERNRLLTIWEVLSRKTGIQLLPALLLTELFMWAFALRGWRYLRVRFQTYAYLWRHRARIRQRHQTIQTTRAITDAQLMTGSLVSLPFDQLIGGPLGRICDAIIRPVYSLLRPRSLSQKGVDLSSIE